jgi:hypothetical protein
MAATTHDEIDMRKYYMAYYKWIINDKNIVQRDYFSFGDKSKIDTYMNFLVVLSNDINFETFYDVCNCIDKKYQLSVMLKMIDYFPHQIDNIFNIHYKFIASKNILTKLDMMEFLDNIQKYSLEKKEIMMKLYVKKTSYMDIDLFGKLINVMDTEEHLDKIICLCRSGVIIADLNYYIRIVNDKYLSYDVLSENFPILVAKLYDIVSIIINYTLTSRNILTQNNLPKYISKYSQDDMFYKNIVNLYFDIHLEKIIKAFPYESIIKSIFENYECISDLSLLFYRIMEKTEKYDNKYIAHYIIKNWNIKFDHKYIHFNIYKRYYKMMNEMMKQKYQQIYEDYEREYFIYKIIY